MITTTSPVRPEPPTSTGRRGIPPGHRTGHALGRSQYNAKDGLRFGRRGSMRVILDVVQGPRKGRSFVFDRHDTFIVGRSRSVHCPMPEDSALSRDHFLIEINPPRCEVRDLGSTNGTYVNEQKVERTRLTSGDRIAAGQSVFLVRVEGESSS